MNQQDTRDLPDPLCYLTFDGGGQFGTWTEAMQGQGTAVYAESVVRRLLADRESRVPSDDAIIELAHKHGLNRCEERERAALIPFARALLSRPSGEVVGASTSSHLISFDDAHIVAFEAAAAFRPSYFSGKDFRAHSWVVEAVRSAHMDGQRFAQGLPRIKRTAAPTAPASPDARDALPHVYRDIFGNPAPDALQSVLRELDNKP